MCKTLGAGPDQQNTVCPVCQQLPEYTSDWGECLTWLMEGEDRCTQLEQAPEDSAEAACSHSSCSVWLMPLPGLNHRETAQGYLSWVTWPLCRDVAGWPSWKAACMNKLTPSALLSWSLTSPETVRKPRPFFTSKDRSEPNSMASIGYFWMHWKHRWLFLLFTYNITRTRCQPPRSSKGYKTLNNSLYSDLTAWTRFTLQ